MTLYHLEKTRYENIWPPEGTLFAEGRWNKAGQWIIYCSPTISLAKLEILANENLPIINRVCMTIDVDGSVKIEKIDPEHLPANWMRKPYPTTLHHLTDRFVKSGGLIFKVPSAQSYRESNYLINVRHPEFYHKIKLRDVRREPFDPRLTQKKSTGL